MTVKPEIVEAVAKRLGTTMTGPTAELIEAYHAVMRERREEVLKAMIAVECKHARVPPDKVAYGELNAVATWRDIFRGPCERAFNTIFGDEQ